MRTYTIKEGKHYSRFPFPKFHKGVYAYNASFIFNSTCNYNVLHNGDLNKLCGITYGLIHRNSIRIAWKPSHIKGYIELYSYVYHKGVRNTKYICDVHVDRLYKLTISITGLYCIINITVELTKYNHIIEQSFDYNKWGVFCFPYFGGNLAAPHEMTIDMKYCYR